MPYIGPRLLLLPSIKSSFIQCRIDANRSPFYSFSILLLCHVIVALFEDSIMLLWTLIHLVLGVSWLVIFGFGDCCKGNIVPRIGRKRGWIFVKACELNSNHPERLSFSFKGLSFSLYCKLGLHQYEIIIPLVLLNLSFFIYLLRLKFL